MFMQSADQHKSPILRWVLDFSVFVKLQLLVHIESLEDYCEHKLPNFSVLKYVYDDLHFAENDLQLFIT